MAMTRIRVGLLPATLCLVGTVPEPRVDRETGQIVTDRETGETLVQVTVMLTEDGRAEMMRLTVPESGVPEGVVPGSAVRPVDLFATPWARLFNGQLNDGVAYRARKLELVPSPAQQTPAQPSGAAERKKAA